jgi:hypothetical protein
MPSQLNWSFLFLFLPHARFSLVEPFAHANEYAGTRKDCYWPSIYPHLRWNFSGNRLVNILFPRLSCMRCYAARCTNEMAVCSLKLLRVIHVQCCSTPTQDIKPKILHHRQNVCHSQSFQSRCNVAYIPSIGSPISILMLLFRPIMISDLWID